MVRGANELDPLPHIAEERNDDGGAAQQKAAASEELTRAGRRLEANYARELDALRARLQTDLPRLSARKKDAYFEAQEAEKGAVAGLKAAQQTLGKVATAKALVEGYSPARISNDRGCARTLNFCRRRCPCRSERPFPSRRCSPPDR